MDLWTKGDSEYKLMVPYTSKRKAIRRDSGFKKAEKATRLKHSHI